MKNLEKLLEYLEESYDPRIETRATKFKAAEGKRAKLKLVWMWIKQGVINFEEFSALINLIEREL
jgi:hypothetical protein